MSIITGLSSCQKEFAVSNFSSTLLSLAILLRTCGSDSVGTPLFGCNPLPFFTCILKKPPGKDFGVFLLFHPGAELSQWPWNEGFCISVLCFLREAVTQAAEIPNNLISVDSHWTNFFLTAKWHYSGLPTQTISSCKDRNVIFTQTTANTFIDVILFLHTRKRSISKPSQIFL